MVGNLSSSVSKSVDDGGAMLMVMMAKESLKIFRGNVYGLILIEAFFAANATAAEEFPVINPFAGRSVACHASEEDIDRIKPSSSGMRL